MADKPLNDIRPYAPLATGMLRRRLTIQQHTDVADGSGGWTTTWATVTQAWGAIVKPTFAEIMLGQQVRERVMLHYIIRYPPTTAILPGMRLLDFDSTGGGGLTFTIISAQDVDGTRRQMRITCEQVAPGS